MAQHPDAPVTAAQETTCQFENAFETLHRIIERAHEVQSRYCSARLSAEQVQQIEETLREQKGFRQLVPTLFAEMRPWIRDCVSEQLLVKVFEFERTAELAVSALVWNVPRQKAVVGEERLPDKPVCHYLYVSNSQELREQVDQLSIAAQSAMADFGKYVNGYAGQGYEEWKRRRQTACSGIGQERRFSTDKEMRSSVDSVPQVEAGKEKDKATELPSDEAGRLAKRFTSASDDFPELAALVWFNLTPAVRSQLGSEFDLSPPMFGVVGQRGKLCTHGHYGGECWTVQFSMDDPDTVRFNRACERFKSLASQAKVPDIVGRPPADDARLLTLLAEAPGVEKWGRHPTDPYLWADPTGRNLHQIAPSWDDPKAVRRPARPDLGIGASVSAPVPSAEVLNSGFIPTWWCALLPNVFLRAAEWLRQTKRVTKTINNELIRTPTMQQPPAQIRRTDLPNILLALKRLDDILANPTPTNAEAVKLIAKYHDHSAPPPSQEIREHFSAVPLWEQAMWEFLPCLQPSMNGNVNWDHHRNKDIANSVDLPTGLRPMLSDLHEKLLGWQKHTYLTDPIENEKLRGEVLRLINRVTEEVGASPSTHPHAGAPKGKAAKKKPGKLKVPIKHRDALTRYLKWKEKCEGMPMIKKFWEEVMSKLPAYKFAHDRSERDRDDFRKWYKHNYSGRG